MNRRRPLEGRVLLTELERVAPAISPTAALGTQTPRVSVIVPCYNTARFVAETLQSVFAQTFRSFEVVVVNDGSPDTTELERAIAPWRDKIVYLRTENCGLAGARNNGIRASKGELIALLDSDDTWESNYLEVQVRKLDEDPTADIVYPRFVIIGDGSTAGTRTTPSTGDVTFSRLVGQEVSVVVSVLARRTALERAGLFDDSLRSCEDFDMWLRCIKHGSRIIYHNEVLLRYRVRDDSLSADPVWMYTNAGRVLAKMRTTPDLTGEERVALEAAIRRFDGNRLFYEGKRAFLDGDMPLAVQRLTEANARLHSSRIRLILFGIQAMPQTARRIYRWRLHQSKPIAWALRRDVN